ncbi:hypothetical protein [Pseudomonas syringae]|uniref:hypothetical protein n=1 Tax=Pseudomonas syringae TaxID=317 RepID=UPI0004085886|nr:hypothetical protein [Pseudomonas syringae]UOF22020.1 hypothetical protein N023_11115 [Pseudomonas syringae CC440]UZA79602.1 hypothetical protein EZZ79_11600 [Pseudomonas syringae]
MNNQFKPGDLALIVGAFSMVENIGKQCELIQLVQLDEIYTAPNGLKYQHADVPVWIVRGEGLCRWFEDGTVEQSDWGLCAPVHLMPLRDDFIPEQQKADEAQPA